MSLESFVNPIGIMFGIIATGIILRKIKIISSELKAGLTDLLILFILPCSIVLSFQAESDAAILFKFGLVFLISAGIHLLSLLLCFTLYRRNPPERKAVLRYATLVSNAGFMGFPIAESLYGVYGLMYTAIYLIPVRIFAWSVGVGFFTARVEGGAFKKLLTHPCIVAVVIGIILMVTQLQLPYILYSALKSIGSCTTPLAMLLIGSILAEAQKENFAGKTIFFFCFIRLLLIPAVTFTGCFLLGVERTIASVSVLLAGMPGASITAVLAARYNGDEQFASMCVVVSTMLSLLTIPAWYIAAENLL